jgi:hypothetical protein
MWLPIQEAETGQHPKQKDTPDSSPIYRVTGSVKLLGGERQCAECHWKSVDRGVQDSTNTCSLKHGETSIGKVAWRISEYQQNPDKVR